MKAHILIGLALLAAPLARADGAFPSELGAFFPAGQPNEIVLATNFGLLISSDQGQTFDYVCEQPLITSPGNNVVLYQVADDGTILADTGAGIFRSGDACGWSQAGGALVNVPVVDAAFDPTRPGVVFALANPAFDQAAIQASTDDGATFGPPLWSGNADLHGVEFSRSQSGRVYVTGNAACPGQNNGPAFLLRSDDSGATWTTYDLSALGDVILRIAQVDPKDPATVYFRLTALGGGGDWLVTTHDSGATLKPSLRLGRAPMSAFLRATDGSLYVASSQDELFRLSPGASVWQRLVGGAHLGCLAEAQGAIFGCGDDFRDAMALGSSSDQGQTFCPLFQYKQLNGLLGCAAVQQQCATTWQQIAREFCPGDAGPCPEAIEAGPCLVEGDGGQFAVGADPLPAGDGGVCALVASWGADGGPADGGSSAQADGGTVASVRDGGSAADAALGGPPPVPRPATGCGCGASEGLPQGFALTLLGLVLLARRRRDGRSG